MLAGMDPLIVTIVASTVALIGTLLGSVFAIGRQVGSIRAEGAADRRALRASMDAFRQEMQRLAEHQSHLEGKLSASD